MRAARFFEIKLPALSLEVEIVIGVDDWVDRDRQLRGTAGVGVGLALALPSPVLSLVLVFEFILVFELVFVLRRPLLPRRVGLEAGVAGGIGPASVAGVAGSGVDGLIIGSGAGAGIAGVAGIARGRTRSLRTAAAGVNEHAWPEPGTAISVRRSPALFARIETIVGTVPGVVGVGAVDSPNCIATPV
jgi:hypothetical protein